MILRKIGRELENSLQRKGEFNHVILVEGARQVGKTTLVRQVLSSLRLPFREVNLEEDRVFCEKIDRCGTFDDFTQLVSVELNFEIGGNEVLFIDEAQESRALGRYVRFMKEKWPRTQVVLSGSSMSRIFRDDVRYPVGRVVAVHVKPFSFDEFLLAGGEKILLEQIASLSPHPRIIPETHSRLLELLQKYLEVGGLPEVACVFFSGGNWKAVRENILLGYYNDFKRVYGEERRAYFIAALKAVACLLGSPFKNSFVSEFLDGGKNQEIIKALSQLEAWKMVIRADQHGVDAETRFHPKRYLFDAGIAKQLREEEMANIHLLHTMESKKRTPLGGLLENVMANHLTRELSETTGWKKSASGSEIDFVVKKGGHLVPVECKASPAIKNTHLGGVRDFLKIYKSPLAVVAGIAPFEVRKISGGKVVILPLYLAGLLEEALDAADGLSK